LPERKIRETECKILGPDQEKEEEVMSLACEECEVLSGLRGIYKTIIR